ncbi:MAG TPA: metalloregulator ArsR/SmtB family transcription factor [Planctomycetota bacterium]|nr:metalloregulator ArsR/SmtB family transcription factor [Planctomycetota bacterium]
MRIAPERLNVIFQALAHEARRDMLKRLSRSSLTVCELAEPLAMSLAAASKHIKVLETAGLVQRTILGRRHLCCLEPGPLATVSDWLLFYQRFWHERLDALENLFPGGSPPQPER